MVSRYQSRVAVSQQAMSSHLCHGVNGHDAVDCQVPHVWRDFRRQQSYCRSHRLLVTAHVHTVAVKVVGRVLCRGQKHSSWVTDTNVRLEVWKMLASCYVLQASN